MRRIIRHSGGHRLVRTPPAHASARARGRAPRRRTRHGRRRARHAQPPTDQILVRLAARHEPRRERPRRDRRDQAQAACAGSRTARTSSSCRSDTGPTRCARSPTGLPRVAMSSRPSRTRSMQPLSVPTDPSWSQEWDMFAPSTGNYGIDLPGARDITLGSSSITIGVIDTGYRPHIDLTGRFVGRLRLHRRHSRRERRQRTRLGCARPRRLDHERREREWVLRRLRCVQQLVARHPRVGHDRRRFRQRHRRRRDQPGLEDPAAAGARKVRRLHERHRRRDPLVGRIARERRPRQQPDP